MGFSLPAAIGAAFANPNKTIYCFNGDGGFHIACQSLLLISQYRLNIKVVVLNNKALGMITQFQNLYFNGRMAGTIIEGGYDMPNIQALAVAYRIPYKRIESNDIDDSILKKALSENNCIIEYCIEGETIVSPKLEYNQPIFNPYPYIPKEELSSLIPNWNE